MFETSDHLQWTTLARPYGQAERALGKLAHSLETTPLHATWLWRELTRIAVTLAQISGFQTSVEPLRLALIGASLDQADHSPGLAAAIRIFLDAAPLFRQKQNADSGSDLWPRFWQEEPATTQETPDLPEAGREGNQSPEKDVADLVSELAAFADDGQRPALINLFVDLRQHAAARSLPPAMLRLAVPLSLVKSGLVPKPAPGLLGGRRLALGMSRGSDLAMPLTPWLEEALRELAKEADQAHRRLAELTRHHRAWRQALQQARLRRHDSAPKVLDLLAATPVVTIGLVSRMLDLSHVAAGQIIGRLAAQGVLVEQTARSRHKIFMAGDLAIGKSTGLATEDTLDLSAPADPLDVDALEATLDQLYADLERLTARSQVQLDKAGT